jgi:hypothetical protein
MWIVYVFVMNLFELCISIFFKKKLLIFIFFKLIVDSWMIMYLVVIRILVLLLVLRFHLVQLLVFETMPPINNENVNVLVMDLQQMSARRILVQLKLSHQNLKQVCKNQLYGNILPR